MNYKSFFWLLYYFVVIIRGEGFGNYSDTPPHSHGLRWPKIAYRSSDRAQAMPSSRSAIFGSARSVFDGVGYLNSYRF